MCRLLDNHLALHASALVGLAVVAVGAGHVELGGDGVASRVQVVLVGQSVGGHARGDGVLVEDDVVGETLVVDPGAVWWGARERVRWRGKGEADSPGGQQQLRGAAV